MLASLPPFRNEESPHGDFDCCLVAIKRGRFSARPDRPSPDLHLMYQLAATECRPVDKTRLFIETCTSMAPSVENLRLVRSASSLVRSVLNGADITALREFVHFAEQKISDVDDVLAAAGQTVIDELESVSRINLHDVVRRVAQIERDALAFGARRGVEGNLRTAYAG
jgi:hypothetical protein